MNDRVYDLVIDLSAWDDVSYWWPGEVIEVEWGEHCQNYIIEKVEDGILYCDEYQNANITEDVCPHCGGGVRLNGET